MGGAGISRQRVLVKLLNHQKISDGNEELVGRLSPIIRHFRDDAEIMLLAIAKCPLLSLHASPELFRTREFAFLAQRQIGLIRWVPEQLKDDFEYLLGACNSLKDRNHMNELSRGHTFSPRKLQLTHTYNTIKNASYRIKSDPVLLAHLLDTTDEQDINTFMLIVGPKTAVCAWCERMEIYGMDPLFNASLYEREMKAVVHTFPLVYKYATTHLKNQVDFLLNAIKSDGLMLRYAPSSLQKCQRVRSVAYQQNKNIALHIPGRW